MSLQWVCTLHHPRSFMPCCRNYFTWRNCTAAPWYRTHMPPMIIILLGLHQYAYSMHLSISPSLPLFPIHSKLLVPCRGQVPTFRVQWVRIHPDKYFWVRRIQKNWASHLEEFGPKCISNLSLSCFNVVEVLFFYTLGPTYCADRVV